MSETEKEGKVCPPCGKFEPQAWRKSICRNCFHTTAEHTAADPGAPQIGATPPTSTSDKKGHPAGAKVDSNTDSSKTAENKFKGVHDKDKSKTVGPEKPLDTSKTFQKQQPAAGSSEKPTSLFKAKYEQLSENVNQPKPGPKEAPAKVPGGLAAKFTDKYEKLGGGSGAGSSGGGVTGSGGLPGGVASVPPAKTSPAKPPPPPVLPKTKGKGAPVDKKDSSSEPAQDETIGWKTLPRSKSEMKKDAKRDEKTEPVSLEKTSSSFKDKYEAVTMKAKFGSAENLTSNSPVDITVKSKINAGIKLKFGSADNVSLQKDKHSNQTPSPGVVDKPWDLSKLKSDNKEKQKSTEKSSSLQDLTSPKVAVEINLPKVGGGSIKTVGISVKGVKADSVETKDLKVKEKEPDNKDAKDAKQETESKAPPLKLKIKTETPDKAQETGKTTPVASGKTSPFETGKTTPVASGKSSPFETGKTTPVASGKTSPFETGKTTPSETGKSTSVESAKTTPLQTGKSVSDETSTSTKPGSDHQLANIKNKLYAGKDESKAAPQTEQKSELKSKFEEKGRTMTPKLEESKKTDFKTKSEKDTKSELKSKFEDKDKTSVSNVEESKKTGFKTKFEKDPKSELKTKFEEKEKKPAAKVEDNKKTDKVEFKSKFDKEAKSDVTTQFDNKLKGSGSKTDDKKMEDTKTDSKSKTTGFKLSFGNKQTSPEVKGKETDKDKKLDLKSKSDDKKVDLKSKKDDKDKKPAWKLKLEEREKKSEAKTKVEDKEKSADKDVKPAWKVRLEEMHSNKSKVDEKKPGLKSKLEDKDANSELKSKFDKKFDYKSKLEDKSKSGSLKAATKEDKEGEKGIKEEKSPASSTASVGVALDAKDKTNQKEKHSSEKTVSTESKSTLDTKATEKNAMKLPEVTNKEKSPEKAALSDAVSVRERSHFEKLSPATNALPDDVTDACSIGSTRYGVQSDFTGGSAKAALHVDTLVFTSSKSKAAGLEVADSGSGSGGGWDKKAGVSKEVSPDIPDIKPAATASGLEDRDASTGEDSKSKSRDGTRARAETVESETELAGASRKNGTSQFIADIEQLKLDLQIMAEKCQNLEIENEAFRKDLGTKAMAEAALKKQKEDVESAFKGLQKQLTSLEETCAKLETDNSNLMVKLKAHQENNKDKPVSKEADEIRQQLLQREEMCEDLTEENETLKQEVLDLKVEMEEMYDSFRDQEAEEFRELQKELEITAKNCRILQFKMRKSERRNEQIERERNQYEDKLRLLQNQFEDKDAVSHIKSLEEELRMAKDVSVRLHDELDLVDDKRGKLEDENRQLTELLEQADRKQFRLEMEVDKLRDQLMDLRRELGSKGGRSDDHTERKFRF